MKLVLLAAGRGTRISRYLSGNPKCTVDIGGGQKLINYTIDLFHKKGISDIAIVLGYRQEVIKELLKDSGVKFFYNPFYDVTNSIASMWFAKDYISNYDDTIIMNADVYLEEQILDQILESKKSPLLYADSTRKEEGDYKFKYSNSVLEKYGKELKGNDITGEYIGVGKFSKDFMPVFVKEMEELINSQQHDIWWENILYSMVGHQDVFVEEVNGLFWAEVDYVEDYERILAFRGYTFEDVNMDLKIK